VIARWRTNKTHLGCPSLASEATVCSALVNLGALEVWRTTAPSRWTGCRYIFFQVAFSVCFCMVKRLRPEVRIRSSPPYPCSGGAPSAGRGHVESCAQRISWDPIGFRVLLWFQVVLFNLGLLWFAVLWELNMMSLCLSTTKGILQ
jgi:hypothetical protein